MLMIEEYKRLERIKKEIQRADSDIWTFDTHDIEWLVQQVENVWQFKAT